MLYCELFSSFKIMGAIKDVNIKLWTYNISTCMQNTKNLIGNFGAIHVRIIHANSSGL